MLRFKTGLIGAAIVLLAAGLVSCGGGDSLGAASSGSSTGTTGTTGTAGGTTTSAANVVSVVVDGGPSGLPASAIDVLYTTVTVCVPGSTTQCQSIDHVQVDTGSIGLRILASVLTISLPVTTAADGGSLVECTQFVDGYSWGPVASADVQISGESAASVPIQVIGATNFSSVPDSCSGTASAEDSVSQFGANGVLGIGVFEQDCGAGCVTSAESGFYYSCSASVCASTVASLAQQVPNPVTLFATDNNGTIIDLPAVDAAGDATVTGSLIFGIDTASNNASGTKTVLTVDPSTGYFTTVFNAQMLNTSFLDTGSNGYFFNDSSISACSANSGFQDFDCPATTVALSATFTGQNSASEAVTFNIANVQTLVTANPDFAAVPDVGGTYSTSTTTFDWGLPFYFGREVATAIEQHATSAGTGPYVAF